MQTFKQWQQAPMQGVIPSHPTDWQKESIIDDLSTALPFLQSAYDAAVKAGIKESDYELMCAVGDALNGCNEALERLNDTGEE